MRTRSRKAKRIDKRGKRAEQYRTWWEDFAGWRWTKKCNEEKEGLITTSNDYKIANKNLQKLKDQLSARTVPWEFQHVELEIQNLQTGKDLLDQTTENGNPLSMREDTGQKEVWQDSKMVVNDETEQVLIVVSVFRLFALCCCKNGFELMQLSTLDVAKVSFSCKWMTKLYEFKTRNINKVPIQLLEIPRSRMNHIHSFY